jgi:hypothetical protein
MAREKLKTDIMKVEEKLARINTSTQTVPPYLNPLFFHTPNHQLLVSTGDNQLSLSW